MFLVIDRYLLSLVQKICDKVQEMTGVTKFGVSNLLLATFTICVWIKAAPVLTGVDWITVGMITGYIAMLVRENIQHEKIFLENGSLIAPHYTKFCLQPMWRGIFTVSILLTTLGDIFVWGKREEESLFLVGSAAFLLSIFTMACLPRPPSKSKMRELYEKALGKLSEKLGPQTAPKPSS